ncbi:GAF domain-containing protein [Chroococcidiopsis sp. FACHB-1243]|uniref:GAF domain-containing protein n=1 Tax=Chroococcidiopsis sp. [FACHB-1243] TaxID=2692781 RepID=UPI0017850CAA|nr:GAF domain-containing protein [Chroococcidiopsis sp. [FACHB-1243]]MBD2306856.1 GAF domain-containing protein [Chroococcidiopsis sp. [FACHB-1243]]
MVLWADYDSLPISYKGWNVAVGEKYIGNRQQLATAFTKLLAWLREYMSVDTATLLLPDEDRENLVVYATLGLEEEITQKIRIPIGHGIAGRIAASCKPMVTHNLLAEEIVSPILRQKRLRSLVGVPLPMREGMVGVLHVGSLQERQFTERDVQQLQVVVHRLKSIMVTAQFNYLSDSASKTATHNYKYIARTLLLFQYRYQIQNISSALQLPLNSYWSIAACKCLDIFRCQYILTCN